MIFQTVNFQIHAPPKEKPAIGSVPCIQNKLEGSKISLNILATSRYLVSFPVYHWKEELFVLVEETV